MENHLFQWVKLTISSWQFFNSKLVVSHYHRVTICQYLVVGEPGFWPKGMVIRYTAKKKTFWNKAISSLPVVLLIYPIWIPWRPHIKWFFTFVFAGSDVHSISLSQWYPFTIHWFTLSSNIAYFVANCIHHNHIHCIHYVHRFDPSYPVWNMDKLVCTYPLHS